MSFENKIALSAYYKSLGLSNAAIATLLRVDASSVSRYLRQAEEEAWLQYNLQLHLPRELDRAARATVREMDLEESLFNLFAARGTPSRLRRDGFVVVRTGVEERHGKKGGCTTRSKTSAPEIDDLHLAMMSIEAGRLLLDLLARRDVRRSTILGTTWGRSTGGVIASLAKMSLPELTELLVVPLQGGVGRTASSDVSSQYYPDILAERLSLLFHSRRQPALITLPAYIAAQAAKQVGEAGLKAIWRFIENDTSFQRATEAHQHLDIALIGVGGLEKGAWAVSSGYLGDAAIVNALKKEGAQGDIVCRFFRDGPENPIEGWSPHSAPTETIRQTNLRAIGISLSTLAARIKAGTRVLAVAGGQSGAKARAIYAAVLNGFVTDLVTDDATAMAILRLGQL